MKLALASDIHGSWASLEYPIADILIFAGDILNDYSRDLLMCISKQTEEVERLNLFFQNLLSQGIYKKIVLVSGNHDFCFQRNPKAKELLTNAAYLQDTSVVIDKIKFYGSPWQPWFYDWAFNFPCPDFNRGGNPFRAEAHALACWGSIPDDTQILITHSPPAGILDKTYAGENIGCPYLRDRVEQLSSLKLHVFGHVHYAHGLETRLLQAKANCTFVNAAICDTVSPKNPIQVVDI